MRKKPHYSGQRNNNNNKRRFVRKPGGGGNARYGGGGEDADSVNPRMRKQAQTNREKYLTMGKDALINGDRVESEYYLQHADHYLRIMNAIDAQFTPRHAHAEREHMDAPQEGQETGTAGQMPEPSAGETPVEEEEEFGPNDGAQLASVLPAPRMIKAAE